MEQAGDGEFHRWSRAPGSARGPSSTRFLSSASQDPTVEDEFLRRPKRNAVMAGCNGFAAL